MNLAYAPPARAWRGGLEVAKAHRRFRRRRSWGAAFVAVAVVPVFTAAACGRISQHFSGHSVTRKGTVSASPPAGQVGTTFSLTASGFKPAEPMTFEIDPPHRPRFVGPSHTAASDGRVTSTYTPQPGDPAGTYDIKAVGSLGTRAYGHLIVQPNSR